MNICLTTGTKKITSIHRAANAALAQRIDATSVAEELARSSKDVINISVECQESDIITDSSGEKYRAIFSALLHFPATRDLHVQGPERDTKAEAIKDSEVLGKAYEFEGEPGLRRVAERLERKTWSRAEITGAAESSFEGLLRDPQAKTGTKVEKLIPPGEGWVRSNDEMLWDPRSEVYFVQIGTQMGKYLMKDSKTKQFQEVDTPHTSTEFAINARAGGASLVRKGAKMERTVMLPDMPKIARLALKFPLSFLDSPASAFSIFQGLRSAEAADWCAKNFHTRLLKALGGKIHNWETRELQTVLATVLRDMDSELLKGTTAFSGCNALLALLLGDRLVVSGIGQVRALLLFEDDSTRLLLAGTHDCLAEKERERVEEAMGVIQDGLLHRTLETTDDAQRILRAKNCFEVLSLEAGGPIDEKQIKAAYRKLVLKVHPDKRGDAVDLDAYNKAFARLDSAKDEAETILSKDADACRELCKVLSANIHTRESAAELLGVDKTADTDTDSVTEEAEKACRWKIKSLEKLEASANKLFEQAKAICKEAVETIRRPGSSEALPRQEALLKVGLSTSRAMGARDLRFPTPIVKMEPESAAWSVPTAGKGCRLALLVGATAALPSQRLVALGKGMLKQPKAAALRWCQEADASANSVGAICIGFEVRKRPGEQSPATAKRLKTTSLGSGEAGSVFLRHVLFRHSQLRHVDPMARREGAAKTVSEAEAAALETLRELLASPAAFGKICRERSDCQTGSQPGNMCGHLGWLGRGEQEPAVEEAAFSLEVNDFSDIVTTCRGIHIIQRLG
mmetsp:Transcript_60118/g.155361  ORF Transcript_60118/g.155361 Transcript_60118/m.155361 type:complete len:799 (+) Transcript_60118:47-2443(+)